MAAPAAAASIQRSHEGRHGAASKASRLATAEQPTVAAGATAEPADGLPGSAGSASENGNETNASLTAETTSVIGAKPAGEQQRDVTEPLQPSAAEDTAVVDPDSDPPQPSCEPGHSPVAAADAEQLAAESQPPAVGVFTAAAAAYDELREGPASLPEADAPLAGAQGTAEQHQIESAAEAGPSADMSAAAETGQRQEALEEANVLRTNAATAEGDEETAHVCPCHPCLHCMFTLIGVPVARLVSQAFWICLLYPALN